MLVFFFFSSRRRHTRLTCDWSSDVCSSDLGKWTRVSERGTSGSVQRGPANPARPGREQRYRDHLGCRRSPEVPLTEDCIQCSVVSLQWEEEAGMLLTSSLPCLLRTENFPMSYQVIARKWRPQTFDDLVGQQHVTETLKNAI